MRQVRHAVVCALALAALSTAGDFIWANFISDRRALYGLAHGTLLLAAIGSCLGWRSGRALHGAVGGALIGFAAAGSFFLLRPIFGYGAMLFLWFALWVAFAAFQGRVLDHGATAREVVGRGLIAGLGSGVAFYAISGIWIPFDPRGWDYAVHFVSWTIAYLPAFAALFIGRQEN